jgi:hypothetical protein
MAVGWNTSAKGRPMYLRRPADRRSARLVVDEHEGAAAVDGEHPVAHVSDEVLEERVVDEMGRRDGGAVGRARARRERRGPGGAAGGGKFGCRHETACPRHTQLSCLSP